MPQPLATLARLRRLPTRLGAVFTAVLLLGMAPLTGLLWHLADASRNEQKLEAKARLLQAARFATAVQADAIAAIGHTLALVATQPTDWAMNEDTCVAQARLLTDNHPYMAGFAVLRRDGAVICSLSGGGRGVNLGDRPYVRRTLQHGGLTVGVPLAARISGRVVLPLALRIDNHERADDPNPPAILTATLDMLHIARLLAGTQFLPRGAETENDPGGRVKVMDQDGRMLAQYPDDGTRLVHDHPLNNAVLAVQEGVLEMAGHDGQTRLFGFAHATEANTVYLVSILSSAVTAPADERFRLVMALAVLAALAGLAAAFWVVHARVLRPMELMTRAAERVQQGHPPALPSHRLPAEFEVLRQAMAGMLRTVEAREQSLHRANRDLARMAERDALTGIANRRAFDDAMAAMWRAAQTGGGSVALAIFDVDHFKRFNDRYGHPRGDDCLRKVAETLGAMPMREGDLAARMGGEEFVLLLPGTETEGAVAVAQRALEALRDRMILHEDGVVNEDGPVGIVTASVGVAACQPFPGLDAAALIAAADAALYRAKESGRNRVMAARDVAREDTASEAALQETGD